MHRFLWALSALIVVVFPVSTFGAPASQYVFGRGDFQSGTRATGIAVADFNGDGRSDVAVANQGDKVFSVRQTARSAQRPTSLPQYPPSPSQLIP